MPKERRLTAIMFTDIVGYTSIMGADEDKAFQLLKKNRNIQKPLIENHGGRFLKEMGDGTLASFPSVIEAVYCAKEIQEKCKEEFDLNLRIGIHLGEAIFEDGDVFGDGVNIASRIESLASPGGIIITEAVNQNIHNKKNIDTAFVGEKKLKNVSIPVRLYEVIMPGIKTPSFSQKKEKKLPRRWLYAAVVALILLIISNSIWDFFPSRNINSEINQDYISIAVLPFINRSNDSLQEYFSDGITREIILQLAKIGDLSVTSPRSVFTYKDSLKDLPTIGKELDVSFILEGNVRKQGDKLRITTQLVNTKTGKTKWANDFDRELIELIDVEIDVAKKVAEALDLQLTQPETERIERKSTEKFSAYDYYLKAIFEDRKWTTEGMNNAIKYLNKAIDLDPEFSEAYSLYAWQYVNLGTIGGMDPREAFASALPAVKKAVQYDSLSSDAYLVYGSVNFYLEWNFEEAKKNFEKSMELNSWGESPIYQCICAYVEFLMSYGNISEIWNLFDNIQRIDPNFFYQFEYESILHVLNDDMKLAITAFEKRLPFSDTLDWHFNMKYGATLFLTGSYKEAVVKLENSLQLVNERNNFTLLNLSLSYIQLNKIDKALEILLELIERERNGEFGTTAIIAAIYNELGDEDKTFEYLDKAYSAHDSSLLWLKIYYFRNLNDHPRYKELLRKIGF